jgi:hypothetical protein
MTRSGDFTEIWQALTPSWDYALVGRLDAAHKELEIVERLFPGYTVAKFIAAARHLGSNETYLKQVDHVVAGLRLAGLPEN